MREVAKDFVNFAGDLNITQKYYLFIFINKYEKGCFCPVNGVNALISSC